ncbi:MAG: heme-binding protein [Planctomycetes bacterium]|nr:heme-binding protein [Planctomycetota bacterium]
MLRRLLPLLLLPLAACAFTESDPSKIPDPVKPAPSGPGEVALSSSEPEPPMTTPYAGHSGRASEEGAGATHAVRTPLLLSRVGGDLDARIEIRDGEYRYGPSRIESPLPAGYPEPTPPGAIDVKRYPPVRRAEYVSEGSPGLGMNLGFFPLFNHIKRRDIAMTSPVEMDYRDLFDPATGKQEPEDSMSWTMSFLYRTPDLAPTGEDRNVVVIDRPEITVLSVGMNGPYGTGVVEKGLTLLHAWLKEHPEYEIVGEPRAFHYNGPSVSNRNKWSEVQLPIVKRG